MVHLPPPLFCTGVDNSPLEKYIDLYLLLSSYWLFYICRRVRHFRFLNLYRCAKRSLLKESAITSGGIYICKSVIVITFTGFVLQDPIKSLYYISISIIPVVFIPIIYRYIVHCIQDIYAILKYTYSKWNSVNNLRFHKGLRKLVFCSLLTVQRCCDNQVPSCKDLFRNCVVCLVFSRWFHSPPWRAIYFPN